MSKIGQNIRMKQKDQKPYYTIGIAKTDEGYELRREKKNGPDSESIVVVYRSNDRADVMERMRVEVTRYVMNFNQTEMGD